MIQEENCTYEVCKLAKEKGFNVPTDRYYHIYDDVIEAQNSLEMTSDGCADFYNSLNQCRCAAPTQSLLQRWLREVKNIHIEIIATASGYYWCVNKTNGTSITDSDVLNRGTNEGGCFDTFEESLEDCEKYALENLV